jgi:hypothetical protein
MSDAIDTSVLDNLAVRRGLAKDILAPFAHPRTFSRRQRRNRWAEEDEVAIGVSAGEWMLLQALVGQLTGDDLRALPLSLRPGLHFIDQVDMVAEVVRKRHLAA